MAPFNLPTIWHGSSPESIYRIRLFHLTVVRSWVILVGFQVFPDGIFPAGGKSEIEGIFPPPYFEWFQFNKVNSSDMEPKLDSAKSHWHLRSSFSLVTILSMLMYSYAGIHRIHKSGWVHFVSVWLHGEEWAFRRPAWILPGKNPTELHSIVWCAYDINSSFGWKISCML